MTDQKQAERGIEKADRAVGGQIESQLGRPEKSDPNQIKSSDQLSSSFNDAIKALDGGQKGAGEKMFQDLSKDLEKSLGNAFKKGGSAGLDQEIEKIDAKVDGKGTGLLKVQEGKNVAVHAIRPVNPAVSEILDKAGPSSGRFMQLQDAEGNKMWVERLATARIDLDKLDNNQEAKNNFERKGKTLDQASIEIGTDIKDDLKRFNGQGISESVMKKIGNLVTDTRQATPELQEKINKALEGTGISLKLDYKDKLPGIHGNTVHQSIVEVSQNDKVVARRLQQYDTVRSAGGQAKREEFGVIKDKP